MICIICMICMICMIYLVLTGGSRVYLRGVRRVVWVGSVQYRSFTTFLKRQANISPMNLAKYSGISFHQGGARGGVGGRSGKIWQTRDMSVLERSCHFSVLPSGRSICNECRSWLPRNPYPLTPYWKTLPQVSGKVGGVASLRRLG